MAYNVYSFQDVLVSFSSTSVGAASSTGIGMGSIAIDMATEKTVHEVAADGVVMISKILGENGTVALAMQQTSTLNKYLMKWYNYINNPTTPTEAWADMVITVVAININDKTICTGVSPQKLANRPYQAQGQQVTWTLMAAEITQS